MAGEIESDGEYADTPSGWAQRLNLELTAAKKSLDAWRTSGEKVLSRYLDRRNGQNKDERRWNVFASNIQTQRALLYGKTPKVDVNRRFADADDDVARFAAEMQKRLLNSDIELGTDGYATALGYALLDFLLPGLAQVRLKFDADFDQVEAQEAQLSEPHPETGEQQELAPAVEAHEAVKPGTEKVEVLYTHWRDMVWTPARTWDEVRLLFFRAEMSREDLTERFGAVGKLVPMNSKRGSQQTNIDPRKEDPLARADVWEVWDKPKKCVYWYVEGFHKTLDKKEDPLGLRGFFPCPRPMMANLTTSEAIPTPDYVLQQDVFREIDEVTTRISKLVKALKVVGVYDKTAGEVQRLLKEGVDNTLIPVERFAAFAERGGLRGVVDWLPLDQVVNTLDKLRDYRSELLQASYQLSGMADIMRGQATEPGATATEQGLKAKFGSVRIQAMQDEFARFASDVQAIKAEIISKHFSPETIIERSNAKYTADGQDPQLLQAAVQLIKSEFESFRIEVKPEAVSMQDFAAIKQERTELTVALANFFTASMPMAQAMPGSMSFLLEILKWLVAGRRESATIEGVLDQAIIAAKQAQAKAAAQPQQPAPQDPKLQAAQVKAQGDAARAQADMAKEQFKYQAGVATIQAETQAKDQQEQSQARWNVAEARGKKLVSGPPATPGFGPGPPRGGVP